MGAGIIAASGFASKRVNELRQPVGQVRLFRYFSQHLLAVNMKSMAHFFFALPSAHLASYQKIQMKNRLLSWFQLTNINRL